MDIRAMGMKRHTRGRRVESQPPESDRLRAIAWAFLSSRMMLCADELGIFTELAKEPTDLAALCRSTGLREDMAEEFISALIGMGLIEHRSGMYCNASDVNVFLDRAKSTYIGGTLDLARVMLRDPDNLALCARASLDDMVAPEVLAERMWSDVESILSAADLR
jgi:hypothetical protein